MQNKQIKTQVKEVFKSIQGEGPHVGFEQIFVRFCKCNLNCEYCDTDYKTNAETISSEELNAQINKLNPQNIHSISLTGGEPLLETEFLKEFIPKTEQKIYLETNGSLPEKLGEVIELIDIISMDIKLDSTTKSGFLFDKHEEFIQIAVKNKKEIFLKIVFDQNITDDEIKNCIKLAKPNNIPIVLQPVMLKDKMKISSQQMLSTFEKFIQSYANVRIIPQVHKFLKVE